MGKVFHKTFYHVVWATKQREPLLDGPLRPVVAEAITAKCRHLRCLLHAVGVVADHVHIAVEIPPSLAVASLVGQIKGVASHTVNEFRPGALVWQDGYGVVTFRWSELQKVVAYVTKQEQHHRMERLSPVLETCEDDG